MMTFNTENSLDITYWPKKFIRTEVNAVLDLFFGEGFALRLRPWENQFGNGADFELAFLFFALELRLSHQRKR